MYDIASIYSARSVDDAIRALQADPAAVVIAGGTDVLIKIREGKLAGCSLVSIHELGEELSGVTLADNGDVEIGPLTTFRGVTFSDVIRRTIPVLGEAADMAGGPQLRAAGTIGGNVCNGITSADTASTLVALDAVLRVRGPKGEREVPISQWYQGVGKVALAPYELLVKIVIPYDNYVGYTGHYIKYAQRNAMDIATLGVSCLVKLTSDKKMVDDAALAFGVAGPVPMRSPAAEAAVRGLPIGEAVAAIGEAALADVNPRTSWRASKEFRIQLVKELKEACGLPAAASFKHVSPAGAALGLPLSEVERKMYHIAPDMELSPLACAYARARGADRMSSFGDWIALSDVCDVPTAKLIQHEVSDGIIAPGYEPEALTILAGKKKGNYNVVAIDPAYKPNPVEHKQVYGITFEQGRNELAINADTMLTNWVTENKTVTEEQKRDLIIALITLKYTQSNSVCYTAGGQTIGVGAGQQSRIHCTRLAGQKADNWQLRHMPKVLDLPFRDDVAKPNRDNAIDVYIGDTPEDVIGDDVWAETFTRQPEPLTAEEKKEYLSHVTGVCLGSDAFFPFGDNIERARRSGVTAIVQPGGSIRDQQVIDTCNKYGIAMAFCGIRLFHH